MMILYAIALSNFKKGASTRMQPLNRYLSVSVYLISVALVLSACTRPNASSNPPTDTVVARTAVIQPTETPPPPTVRATVQDTPRATTTPVASATSVTTTDSRADACVAAVDAFVPPVTTLFRAAQAQVSILEAYVQRTTVADVDQAQVEALFADLPTIPVPTCVDEAPEIINYLGLMRDTLYPAFVEMKVELAMGNPDAQSYARVQGWLDELRTFEREIDARLAALPGAVVAVQSQTPTLSPKPYPTTIPTTTRATAAQSALAPACRSAVDRFLDDIDVYVNRATAIHFDLTEYMQGRLRPMTYKVKDAFAGIDALDVPSCTDEPRAIMQLFDQIEINEFNAHIAIIILDYSTDELAQFVTPLNRDMDELQRVLAALRSK